MIPNDVVIAVFENHKEVDTAVRDLIDGGLDAKHFSVVGKGYHTEEKVLGFYNTGDRMKVWGKYGAFWGGLWGLLFGGMFLVMPVLGPVVILGHLAVILASGIEGAVLVGGISAIGAALLNIGVPKDSVVRYETAIKEDCFLVTAHGTHDEMERAKAILAAYHPTHLDWHEKAMPIAPEAAVAAK